MLVRLNCWRGEHNPGDVVDVDEADAAALLHHGAAHPAETAPDPSPAGRVVKGAAVLESATGSGDDSP